MPAHGRKLLGLEEALAGDASFSFRMTGSRRSLPFSYASRSIRPRRAEEAQRVSEIRAPVDGQVLTLRVHVIHGSEGTAVLRLLYRKESQRHRQ